MYARRLLEQFSGKKIYSELYVKVAPGWTKNKKMLADYPKIKEELDKIKKEKAAKEKAAKEKEMAEFKKWKDGVKKKDDEKKQNEKH